MLKKVVGVAAMAIWLLPLSALSSELRPGWVRPAVLVAFMLGYLVLMYLVHIVEDHPRTQRAVLVPMVALGLGASVAWTGIWVLLMMYVVICCVSALPQRQGLIATVAGIGFTAGDLIWEGVDPINVISLTTSVGFSGIVILILGRQSGLIRELSEARAALAEAAVASERLRFARDLHDLLGHTLSVVVVKAEVVRRLVDRDPVTAAAQAAEIEDISRRALVEIREAVTGYRDRGFAEELDSARRTLDGAGIAVTVRQVGVPVADQLFGWVVREGATNVLRHSGATACEIEVSPGGLSIMDNGGGLPYERGNGLNGLAERATALGGTLDAGPRPGGGFRLRVTVPT